MDDFKKNFIMNMLAYVVLKDVSPQELCQYAGIDLEALKQGECDLAAEQENQLWLQAAFLCKDPLFGLHFGESMRIAALGIVGGVIQHSSTVGEAITHARDLIRLFTDVYTMSISHSEKSFTIRFIPDKQRERESPFTCRHMIDLSMVFVLYELDGLLLKKIEPLAIKLPAHLSGSTGEYKRLLRCNNVVYSDEYSIDFDISYWDEPIITANYELQGVLLKKIAESKIAAGETESLKVKVSSFLSANSYLGIPSLDEIAANFNTSPRSLQRKLQEEGVSYQQLADAIRKSLALHYLESGKYPVKEISHILGYNEMSAFTRAFKRWTGTTPGSYQKTGVN